MKMFTSLVQNQGDIEMEDLPYSHGTTQAHGISGGIGSLDPLHSGEPIIASHWRSHWSWRKYCPEPCDEVRLGLGKACLGGILDRCKRVWNTLLFLHWVLWVLF